MNSNLRFQVWSNYRGQHTLIAAFARYEDAVEYAADMLEGEVVSL